MIYHLIVIEKNKARLIHEELTIRDRTAKDLLVQHFESRGFTVKVRIEQ